MQEPQTPHSPASQPPPATPGGPKKKKWLTPFRALIGVIGIVASTSSVVALVWGWVDPDTSAQEQARKLEEIDRKLTTDQEDGKLVNQVSRRVTELGDAFAQLEGNLKQIRLLDRDLSSQPSTAFLTPDQQRLREASRKKEVEELVAKLGETEGLARQFVESVDRDETLRQVQSQDSETARRKAKAVEQARRVREELLAELSTIRAKYQP